MTPIKAFLMEPLMMRRIYLRRFTHSGGHKCAKSEYGCDSVAVLLLELDQPFDWIREADGYRTYPPAPAIAIEDLRWPTSCRHCGRPLPDDAERQVNQGQLWKRHDTGELIMKRDFPPGALYYDDGPHFSFGGVFPGGGPDGKVLCGVCPGGSHWCIDSRASNCTMKDDDKHRCWIRHGDPRDGSIHVDKNGLTCRAGAGSIQTGNWHGFLDRGHFREQRTR